MSGDCCLALPRGAMGLSAVCDCGIYRGVLLNDILVILNLIITLDNGFELITKLRVTNQEFF